MSDNVVPFPGAKATDTLVPQYERVTIGVGDDIETFTLATFCLAKTIRTFALMTELTQAVGLGEVLSAAGESKAAGEFEGEGQVAPTFVQRALAILPVALRDGQPALFRLIGLLVTPNAQLRRMDESGEDIEEHLLRTGRSLAYRGTNEQFVALFLSSVKVIGVETILKNLPSLLKVVRGTA